LGSIALALRKPWLGVLGLAVFGYLNPHRFAWGFSTTLPVYLSLFMAVAISFLIQAKEAQPIPKDWRVPTFYLLWGYFLLTTMDAVVPAAAWPKLIETSKIYLPLIFTLLLITDRQKLFYLVITIASSFALIAVKGGIFAVSTGFAYRVLGPAGTHFGGNNEFAIATLMAIPLVLLWAREAADRRIQLALLTAVPLMFASAISSHSRGALVTMGALVPLLLWHSKRKYLAIPFLVAGIAVAGAVLPEKWFGRMETIETYQEDKSAMGRIRVWQDGIAYALSHPLTGAGFNGWIWVTKRDWHSAYVEALAEHGFVGFILWFALVFGTMLSLTRLPRMTRHIPEMKWVANYCYMLRASLVAYAVGAMFLGITYWDLLYHLIFIAVLVRKFALEELAQYECRVASPASQPPLAPGALNPSAGRVASMRRADGGS
jgi:probable O-glycosylation ligase (exosortase A-associated)